MEREHSIHPEREHSIRTIKLRRFAKQRDKQDKGKKKRNVVYRKHGIDARRTRISIRDIRAFGNKKIYKPDARTAWGW